MKRRREEKQITMILLWVTKTHACPTVPEQTAIKMINGVRRRRTAL